jgi:sortase B
MKPKIQTVILFFLTAVFAVSAFMLVRQMTSYRAGDEAYAEASEIAAIPEVPETETVQQPTEQPPQETQTEPEPAPSADPYAQALEQMDLPALQQVNSDVIGWIAIPGTEISYPLVQGTDNDTPGTKTAAQSARFSWTAAALPISAALTPSCTVTG